MELRAYKLGKEKKSYNQIEIVARSSTNPRQIVSLKDIVEETPSTSEFSIHESLKDSQVTFSAVVEETGVKVKGCVFLVHENPVRLHALPSSSQQRGVHTDHASCVLPPFDRAAVPSVEGEMSYTWAPVLRRSCTKGCRGPLLHVIKRMGRNGKRGGATDGGDISKIKDPRKLYLAIDEACTHVRKNRFRLLFALYDVAERRMIGSGVSPPIRCLANNDVPGGVANFSMMVRGRPDWSTWDRVPALAAAEEEGAKENDPRASTSSPNLQDLSTPRPALQPRPVVNTDNATMHRRLSIEIPPAFPSAFPQPLANTPLSVAGHRGNLPSAQSIAQPRSAFTDTEGAPDTHPPSTSHKRKSLNPLPDSFDTPVPTRRTKARFNPADAPAMNIFSPPALRPTAATCPPPLPAPQPHTQRSPTCRTPLSTGTGAFRPVGLSARPGLVIPTRSEIPSVMEGPSLSARDADVINARQIGATSGGLFGRSQVVQQGGQQPASTPTAGGGPVPTSPDSMTQALHPQQQPTLQQQKNAPLSVGVLPTPRGATARPSPTQAQASQILNVAQLYAQYASTLQQHAATTPGHRIIDAHAR